MPVKFKSSSLTAAELRADLEYDPLSGVFTALVSTSSRRQRGDVAGGVDSLGYCSIRVRGVYYFAHRLAWLYMNGEWPKDQIDHINGVRSDNRWTNLREASHLMNCQNRRVGRGVAVYMGVRPASHGCRGYVAEIKHNYKAIYIGTFPTPELAYDAYLNKKRELHAGCTL